MNDLGSLGSVVIPAHNEASVIGRSLDTLLLGFQPGELEVIVSCNGCTDGTADIVRASGHAVRIIEIATPSKAAALRAADQVAKAFPRLYLDADVVMPAVSARSVLEHLRSGLSVAARPPIEYNSGGSSFLVRSYYRARSRIPAVMGSLWGAGAYGLSAEGRNRFDGFPDLIADDLFVDQHFRRDEITVIDSTPVLVNVPRRTPDLMRILRRAYRGNSENRALSVRPPERVETTTSTVHDLIHLARSEPERVADILIYSLFAVAARFAKTGGPPVSWERDNSSRDTGRVADQSAERQNRAAS